MGKETVTIPSEIERHGVVRLQHLVGSSYGIHLSDQLMGGRYRVSRQGKIAKRIRRNLKRELNIDVDNQVMTEIGNLINKYSLKDETYLAEYVDDLMSVVGQFADDDSCFRVGRQNHHHLLAMIDAGVQAFCVYRSNGRNLGRSWVYRDISDAEVFFNGYGFDLVKIAKIASTLNGGKPFRTGRIQTTEDIWLNNGGNAYIMGGDTAITHYTIQLAHPDSFAPHRCNECSRPIWNEDDTREAPDGSTWCASCYRRTYWRCPRCDRHVHRGNELIARLYGSRHYENVCMTCATEHYHTCDYCSRDQDNSNFYMEGRLTTFELADGSTLRLCRDHAHSHTSCSICGGSITDETAKNTGIEVLWNRAGNVIRVCPRCIDGKAYISFCTECLQFSGDRYERTITHCRACRTTEHSTHVTLIVRDPGDVDVVDANAGNGYQVPANIQPHLRITISRHMLNTDGSVDLPTTRLIAGIADSNGLWHDYCLLRGIENSVDNIVPNSWTNGDVQVYRILHGDN